MSDRAQIILSDLVFALVAFLILLSAFFIQWNKLHTRYQDTLLFQDLEIHALQIADLLVQNPGVPNDWETNPTNVQVLGLASSDRVLSAAKVNALSNLS